MPRFEQGGAEHYAEKKTKAALKEEIKKNPSKVYLYSTLAFPDDRWSGYAHELPEGVEFNVVGPDPFKARNWYATVKRNAKGEVICV